QTRSERPAGQEVGSRQGEGRTVGPRRLERVERTSVDPREARRPAARFASTMGIRVPRRFRSAVASVRAKLRGRERRLFDLTCFAANLAFHLPRLDINLEDLSGTRDPRRALVRARARFFRSEPRAIRPA